MDGVNKLHMVVRMLRCRAYEQLVDKQARGYKTIFILNSAEDEIYHAHKC